jgi:hypothetical protein
MLVPGQRAGPGRLGGAVAARRGHDRDPAGRRWRRRPGRTAPAADRHRALRPGRGRPAAPPQPGACGARRGADRGGRADLRRRGGAQRPGPLLHADRVRHPVRAGPGRGRLPGGRSAQRGGVLERVLAAGHQRRAAGRAVHRHGLPPAAGRRPARGRNRDAAQPRRRGRRRLGPPAPASGPEGADCRRDPDRGRRRAQAVDRLRPARRPTISSP